MEQITGIATAIQNTTVPGDEYRPGSFRATFVVGESGQVRLESDGPPGIEDGDLVVVAGNRSGYLLNALAYRNVSKNNGGNVGKLTNLFGGLIALGVACWGTSGFMSALFAASGVWSLVRASRIAAAESQIAHAEGGGPGGSSR